MFPLGRSLKFESPAAIQALTTRLRLSDDWTQDWALEVADAARLKEFVEAYTVGDLNGEEKFALMALTIASLDNYLSQTPPKHQDRGLQDQIERLLSRDFSLHESTIESWCHFDDPDDDRDGPDNGEEADLEERADWAFHVTPMMRRIWEGYRSSAPSKPQKQQKRG